MIIGFIYTVNLFAQCSVDPTKSINEKETLNSNNQSFFEDYYTHLNNYVRYKENNVEYSPTKFLKDMENKFFANEGVYVFDDLGELGFGNNADTYIPAKTYWDKFNRIRTTSQLPLPRLTVSKNNKVTEPVVFCYKNIPVYQIVVEITYGNKESKTLDFYIGKNSSNDTDFRIYAILKHGEPIPFKMNEKEIISSGTISKPPAVVQVKEPTISLSPPPKLNSFTNKLSVSIKVSDFQTQSLRVKLKSDIWETSNFNRELKLDGTASNYSLSDISLQPYKSYLLYVETTNPAIKSEINKSHFIQTTASSTRKYLSIGASALTIGLGAVALIESNNYYNKYQDAGLPADAEKYRNQTKSWDTVRNVSFGVSVVPLYFLVTSFCKKDPLLELFK